MPKLRKAAIEARREITDRLFEEPEPDRASIFGDASRDRPLADRMRPRTLAEFVGQEKIVAPGRALRKMIEEDRLQSLIFRGPPGAGQTTLARLIANSPPA